MTGKSIKCSSCGASLSVPGGLNKVFCAYCGTENMLSDILEIPGLTLICLKCDTRNKDDNFYCDKCGARLQKRCKFCSEMHPLNKKFCPKTGQNIEEEIKDYLINLNMILISAGSFEMGSNGHYTEKPPHHVTLSNFFISDCPVTNSEYCAFLNAMGNLKEKKVQWLQLEENDYCGIIKENDKYKVKEGYHKRPVVYVSWYGAVAFCNWLSESEGFEKCYGDINKRGNPDIAEKGYRLPTEAEWEYSCRGKSKGDYFWGDAVDGSYCWYSENSGENHHDVGSVKANNFGLYDMSGNVWEWCSDWFGNYTSETLSNPVGPASGSYKVVRGGSWKCEAGNCRSSARSSLWAGSRSHSLGFRIARRSH